LINVLGLGAGIGCTIVAYAVFSYAHGFDAFHKNANEIYRVVEIREWNGEDTRFGPVPWDLGELLVKDCPYVTRAVRIDGRVASLKRGQTAISEYVTLADSGLFKMFSVPVIAGSIDLSRKDQVAISEPMTRQYFGEDEPLGKVLSLSVDGAEPKQFTVSAILGQIPSNTNLRVRCVVSSQLLPDSPSKSLFNLTHETRGLFIQVPDRDKIDAVKAQLNKYVETKAATGPYTGIKSFTLDPLKEMTKWVSKTANNDYRYSTPNYFVNGVLASDLLILLLAIINYINTSIAASSSRMKEVAVRKTIGAEKRQLIGQLLCEHTLICVAAVVLGFCFAELLARGINRLFYFVRIHLSPFGNPDLIIFIIIAGVFTALASGLYPAWVASSYSPLDILKRGQKIRSGILNRILLVLQFAIAMMVVVASLVFLQNVKYNRDIDPGYDLHSVLNVSLPVGQDPGIMQRELEKVPGILDISGSSGGVGFGYGSGNFTFEGKQHAIVQYFVTSNYPSMMGFRLKEGRFFDPAIPSDSTTGIVVNESFVRELGLTSPAGQTLNLGVGSPKVVLGVVQDFLLASTSQEILPCMFVIPHFDLRYHSLHMRVAPGAEKNVKEEVEAVYVNLYPDDEIEMYWQDDITLEAIRESTRMLKLNSLLSSLAILIGIMGLVAFVSSNIVRRTKEVGIRKVLGASVPQVVLLINRDLILMLVIAIVIADVGGYYIIGRFLDSIWPYHVGVGFSVMIAGNLLVAIVALLTVSWQVWRVATSDPVASLRYE